MTVRAWRDGWTRVAAAPAIVAGVYLMTVVMALPLAFTMRGLLAAHLGRSLAAEEAARGVNYPWWQEFASQATGLGTTFSPTIIGVAATLDTVSSVLDGEPKIVPVLGAAALYLAAWTFLVGGVIDRFARQRPTRAFGFFGAAGRHLFILIRLAAMAGVVYWWLFTYVHEWLFEGRYPGLIQDTNLERRALLVRLALYLVFGALLLGTNAIFDYAKVRAVVEDRRSAVGALVSAVRFVRRRPGRTLGLYALDATGFLLLVGAWAVVAPGVTSSGWAMGIAVAASQVYILARLILKLQFLGSEVALFQASLAHAGYTAAPAIAWPESPAAEATGASHSGARGAHDERALPAEEG